jgi:Ca2+-binding RTX toxin-like protein
MSGRSAAELSNGNIVFSWIDGVTQALIFEFLNPVDGASGNDVLLGTSVRDELRRFAGNDILYGKGGDDRLDGGLGLEPPTTPTPRAR